MKHLKSLFTAFVLLILLTACSGGENSDAALKRKVEKLVRSMNTDEKIAQLYGIRPKRLLGDDGKLSLEKCRQLIPHGVGHLSQFGYDLNFDQTALREYISALQHYLVTETPSGIPAIFHEEAISGFTAAGATVFPQHIGVACSWNTELIRQKSEYTARTMRSVGGTMALSPMLDVSKTAHFERMEEGFGEDGYLTACLGMAFVEGLQQGGVLPTAKHFAGYGGIPDSENELFEETLYPFEAVTRRGGVISVMPGYHKWKGVNCIGSHELLTDILRNRLGFDGAIVSDYGAVNHLGKGKEAAAKALLAGCDIELPLPEQFPFLKDALADGLITEKNLDDALRRALMLKAKAGLLDKKDAFIAEQPVDFDPKEHRQTSYELATQSIVLLKNNNALPLADSATTIALFGPNAGAVFSLLGDYTHQNMIRFFRGLYPDYGNPRLVTLLEGLTDRLPAGKTLLYERGCNWSSASDIQIDANAGDPQMKNVKATAIRGLPIPDIDNALKIAAKSDIVIAAMGENLYLSGEGRNRGSIRLPDEQENFLRRIIAVGKPVVLIIFGGRPLVITEFEPHCAAILQAWYPGEEGGNAVADILTGKVNPSAKLCTTYPKSNAKNPVGYRYGYNNTNNDPMYPFGHGLSYTTYGYDSLKITGKTATDTKKIDVSLTVNNNGQRDGAEIVQLYIVSANNANKTARLRGFKRVELRAGDRQKITFSLSPQLFAQYSAGKWTVEPGRYEILIGASSTDVRLKQEITLAGKPVSMKHRTTLFSD
ncbi:MAG: glycoside hydrolase family 3 C-terminal domain-containing protein [Prevotellaceae bacterium]|nr:glycoside hydrolase family 3 C-terminal domain-containing protein [Prevotellaceae bacterium]